MAVLAPAHLPRASRVLVLADFVNPLDFPGAEQLLPGALRAARATARLKLQRQLRLSRSPEDLR